MPPKWGTWMDPHERATGLTWEVKHIHPTTSDGNEQFDQDIQREILKSKVSYKCNKLRCTPEELEERFYPHEEENND